MLFRQIPTLPPKQVANRSASLLPSLLRDRFVFTCPLLTCKLLAVEHSLTGSQSERSKSENTERAFIAASRRNDRSLEARVVSALQASKVHKERTGKALKITEDIVKAEEMYEEEDHVPPHLRTLHQSVPPRFAAYLQIQSQLRDFDGHGQFPTVGALSDREADINRQFAEAFGSVGRPALGFPSPAPLQTPQPSFTANQQQLRVTTPMSPHTPAFSPVSPLVSAHHNSPGMASVTMTPFSPMAVAHSPMHSPMGLNFPRFESRDNTEMAPPEGRQSRSNSMFQLPIHPYQNAEQNPQTQAAMLRAMSLSMQSSASQQQAQAQQLPPRGLRRSRDEFDGVKSRVAAPAEPTDAQPAKRNKSIGEALSPASGEISSPDAATPFTMTLSPNAKDLFRVLQHKPMAEVSAGGGPKDDASEQKWVDDDMDRMFEQQPPTDEDSAVALQIKVEEEDSAGALVSHSHDDEHEAATTATTTNTESESRFGSHPPLSSNGDEEMFSPTESFSDFLRQDGYIGADSLGDDYWGSEFLNFE